ncbi:MAG: hypothetical protein C4K60_00775 [Ideonella sp. MAG2]|nr:MAG: hypothetical protein C4K60_00775 [Ideonella sp. MAG2]
MKTHYIASAVLAALCLGSMSATAAIKSGKFRTESNLPAVRTGTPLVLSATAQLNAAADELTGANLLSNPDAWGGGIVHMDLDKATNILTLKAQDSWDFQTFHAQVLSMKFTEANESVCGISYLDGAITTPDIAPTVTFADTGVAVSYAVQDVPGFAYFNFVAGGTARFQIQTCVPTAAQQAPAAGRNR